MVYSSIWDFWILLKPRIVYLVAFTAFVGLFVAPGELSPFLSFVALLCISMAAAGSCAINMWYDRDIDFQMSRTRKRPIPSGSVEPYLALELGIALVIISAFLMALSIGFFAALLLVFSSFVYSYFYTILIKRRTPLNIVIGGAAGAFPPILGWCAVTGNIGWESFVLFLIIFFWTPAHFWALSLLNFEDYAKVGLPMLPVVHGIEKTKRHILAYSLLLVITSLVPVAFVKYKVAYILVSGLLGCILISKACRLLRSSDSRVYLGMFKFSIVYLFALFLCVAVCSVRF